MIKLDTVPGVIKLDIVLRVINLQRLPFSIVPSFLSMETNFGAIDIFAALSTKFANSLG